MKKNSIVASIAMSVLMALILFACKPTIKDADIVNKIEAAKVGMSEMSDVNITVKDGDVTLTGAVPNEQARTSIENSVKSIEGVKSVTNNIIVAPPPPPAPPVEINSDDMITQGVNDAIKDFKGVVAEVKDGVITLTGDIKRTDLPRLMQMLNELKPKNVVNNLNIK